MFFTKGVGRHKDYLQSFELALRSAGIEKCNLVTVSSIYPPGCKRIPAEDGVKQLERRVFPKGKDPRGRSYDDLRWSRFKHFAPAEMFTVVDQHVFPFLRTLGGNGSTYAHHMKDARFTIPAPALLAKVVDLLDQVPMEDRDTKGDLYEYMLGKIATAGQNGQFRTPRHIIRLMVEMTAPGPTDIICDPACGTAGFLVAAGEYLRERHPEILRDAKQRAHFHEHAFHGFDFDNTMLRIGSMNMLLHGVENPDIRYRDSLAQDHAGEEERYTLVLANPPFSSAPATRTRPCAGCWSRSKSSMP
jgi:type I restriction enzyme M protein